MSKLLATFQKPGYVAPVVEIGSLVSDEYAGSKPLSRQEPARQKPQSQQSAPAQQADHHGADPGMAGHHCQPHGHLSVMRHSCGAYLCHNCISGATKCPICHLPLHGQKKEEPRQMEPEELPSEDYDEPQDEYRPKSDDDVKSEFGTL